MSLLEPSPDPPPVVGPGETERFSFPGLAGEVAAAHRPADPDSLEREVRRLVDPAAAAKTLHWGRNYLYVARLAAGRGDGGEAVEVVVKQFRGDGLRARVRDRLRGTKAERSWRAALAFLAAGVPTPEPVLWAGPAAGAAGPSFYVCRHLPGALEARYLLRAANAGREAEEFPGIDVPGFLAALGRTIRRLHDAGLWHRDLSSGNVLLDPAAGAPPALYLIDLNRARLGRRMRSRARAQDLSRLAVFRPEHQEAFLRGYWGGAPTPLQRALYLFHHRAFLAKNRAKAAVRGGGRRLAAPLRPRRAHPHIPPAATGAPARDKVVWDPLSDQPHQHAGAMEKLGVRLADARAHAGEAAAVAAALPRIVRRYRELGRELHCQPVPWSGVGLCLRPHPEDPEGLLGLVEQLGVRNLLLRLHPWEDDHAAEEALASELAGRGYDLTFALPQNRGLVKDPGRWRGALEEIAERFLPYGRRFQVGQAINRSKWGIWNVGEYVALARAADEVLRRQPGVELLGPAVIDFEPHATAAVLNLDRPGLRFDVVSSLLYVDRRGAPENRQAGFDTLDKLRLVKAIADTSKNGTGRSWVTEVNWPLREGPHSPAGRAVSVDEETQADYLARYYLLALTSGFVERVYWWQLVARGYGLVDPSDAGRLRPRPAYLALQTLAARLEGGRCEGPLPAPSPARLHLFARPDGTRLVVGWSTAGKAGAVLPGPAAEAWNRDGDPLPVPAGSAVELGSSVRYFRLAP